MMKAEDTHEMRQRVYIEDTDCYGVVFYANYLKYFSRAVQEALGPSQLADLAAEDDLILAVHSIDRGKYAAAARLGSSVLVKSKLLEVGDKLARWEQSAVDAATGQTFVSAETLVGFVNRTNVLVPLPSDVLAPTRGPAEAALSVVAPMTGMLPFSGSPQIISPATVYADEVGPTGLVTLEACLCYFERNRTDFIGGADGLKALQEAGVMVVVARITNAEFVGVGLPRASLLGQQVEARSVIELQRRNTTVVFKQMLYHADRLVAKAEIACVCIRQDTMRVCACPSDLVAKIGRL